MQNLLNMLLFLKYAFICTRNFFLCFPRLTNRPHFLLPEPHIPKTNMQMHKNPSSNNNNISTRATFVSFGCENRLCYHTLPLIEPGKIRKIDKSEFRRRSYKATENPGFPRTKPVKRASRQSVVIATVVILNIHSCRVNDAIH